MCTTNVYKDFFSTQYAKFYFSYLFSRIYLKSNSSSTYAYMSLIILKLKYFCFSPKILRHVFFHYWVTSKLHAFSDVKKLRENVLTYRNNFYQRHFQTATVSPVFLKRVTHDLSQFWAFFHVLYVIYKKIKKCMS